MKGFAAVLDASLHHNQGEQGCLVAFTHCVLQPGRDNGDQCILWEFLDTQVSLAPTHLRK